MLACILPDAGSEYMTTEAVFSTATNFSTVEMSGWDASGFTNKPISTRPSGVKLLGFRP